jgi:cytochrome c553
MLKPPALVFVAALLPTVALGLSPQQQELAAVRHARPDLDRGAELFRTCLVCHGPDGNGTPDGNVPRIAGQHAAVLAQQLVDFRYGRRWDPRMEHFADRHHLPDAQAVANISAYLQQLPRSGAVGAGDGKQLALGAGLYAQQCRVCHGSAGEGDAQRLTPQLAGQHYEYLRRQIYDAVDGRRHNFSAAHIRLLASLQHDDIAAVCDYLSRFGGQDSRPMPAEGPVNGTRVPLPTSDQ